MFGFRPGPADQEILNEFEANAERAVEVQEKLLYDILKRNAKAEYLERHGLQGRTDVTSFKSMVPVILHADIANDIQRIANGDGSPILSVDPIEKFSLRTFHVEEGASAVLAFVFAAKRFETEGGLVAGTATSNYFHSDDFILRDHAVEDLTSPDEVILQGADFRQVMYCHLLCGLLRRRNVGVIMSFFAYMVVEAFRMLENFWEELCEDIRLGSLNEQRVSDPVLRKTMARVMKADPGLADLVETECRGGSSWDGIVGKLWPNVKFVLCVMTGAMAPYTSSLKQFAGNIPLVNSDYGASECFPIGINMNPLDPPAKVVFTMVPSSAYVEFSPIATEEQAAPEVVDLCFFVQDCTGTGWVML